MSLYKLSLLARDISLTKEENRLNLCCFFPFATDCIQCASVCFLAFTFFQFWKRVIAAWGWKLHISNRKVALQTGSTEFLSHIPVYQARIRLRYRTPLYCFCTNLTISRIPRLYICICRYQVPILSDMLHM